MAPAQRRKSEVRRAWACCMSCEWGAELLFGTMLARRTRNTEPNRNSPLRLMESPHSVFRMHWDHEPDNAVGARLCEPQRVATAPSPAGHRPALRGGGFMESRGGFLTAHWDHEPIRFGPRAVPARSGHARTRASVILTQCRRGPHAATGDRWRSATSRQPPHGQRFMGSPLLFSPHALGP